MAQGPSQGRPKALVVDDNPVNQMVASGFFGHMGFDVETADDGEQAIEACLRNPPDLVLMDVAMPVMDGLEATRRLRALQHDGALPRFPIVAASASILGNEPGECLAAGMDAFLEKPMLYEALAAVVQRVRPVEGGLG
jgi:CheY-like chemotaxis protein